MPQANVCAVSGPRLECALCRDLSLQILTLRAGMQIIQSYKEDCPKKTSVTQESLFTTKQGYPWCQWVGQLGVRGKGPNKRTPGRCRAETKEGWTEAESGRHEEAITAYQRLIKLLSP